VGRAWAWRCLASARPGVGSRVITVGVRGLCVRAWRGLSLAPTQWPQWLVHTIISRPFWRDSRCSDTRPSAMEDDPRSSDMPQRAGSAAAGTTASSLSPERTPTRRTTAASALTGLFSGLRLGGRRRRRSEDATLSPSPSPAWTRGAGGRAAVVGVGRGGGGWALLCGTASGPPLWPQIENLATAPCGGRRPAAANVGMCTVC
jgi:hypothetical protein